VDLIDTENFFCYDGSWKKRLTAYVGTHPEVDMEIIVPHRENMERLLEQMKYLIGGERCEKMV
ncbi:MAG: hypothetical protein HFH87_14305, partial [Lachnospiraceae bacterium]|nr:hypothetical protein [Lachnospiraceae bacterium]